jgi:hypothetical protein
MIKILSLTIYLVTKDLLKIVKSFEVGVNDVANIEIEHKQNQYRIMVTRENKTNETILVHKKYVYLEYESVPIE